MAARHPDSAHTEHSTWHRVTVSLLGGLTVASTLFCFVAAVQTPGLDPPPETVALFVVAATAAAVSYLLVRQRVGVGYLAGILTGVVVVVEAVVVVAGAYGPPGPETNPVGPAMYLALAVSVVVASAMAWREHSGRHLDPASTTT